jgi:hypothetical protein
LVAPPAGAHHRWRCRLRSAGNRIETRVQIALLVNDADL